MKALTVLQPWAWAIAHGHKDVENRRWRPPSWLVGTYIAIHAGQHYDTEGWEQLASPLLSPLPVCLLDPATRLFPVPAEHQAVRGAVVGVVMLVGCHVAGPGRSRISPWYAGPVGWRLQDATALPEPVPCRGNQGLWDLPGHVEHAVRAQLKEGIWAIA